MSGQGRRAATGGPAQPGGVTLEAWTRALDAAIETHRKRSETLPRMGDRRKAGAALRALEDFRKSVALPL